MADRQGDAEGRSKGPDKRGVMESISLGSDIGNYCNGFCHSPSMHSSLAYYLPFFPLSQHKHTVHRGVHLLTKALQRPILFVCVCKNACLRTSEEAEIDYVVAHCVFLIKSLQNFIFSESSGITFTEYLTALEFNTYWDGNLRCSSSNFIQNVRYSS